VSAAGFEPTLASLEAPREILQLEGAVYGDNAEVADARFVEWLYARNPAGPGMVWYAPTGKTDAPSAGQVAVVPLRVELCGETGVAGLVLNVATHPHWRGRGVCAGLLAHAVAENARRGLCFTFALPNPNSTPVFLRRAGFADAGSVPLLLVPLDARALVATLHGLPRLGAGLGAGLLAALSAARRWRPPALPVEEVPADWDGIDALWARLRPARAVAVVRDRVFVAWRFGACPTRRYRLYAAWRGRDIAGLVVTRVAPILGMPAGLVVDLALAPGSGAAEVGAALVARAFAEFKASGAALAASLMLPHSPEYRALRAAGFVRCPRILEPQPFRVVLRPHARGIPPQLGGWFLAMADYDVV
jgi:hypothetical protein